MDSRDQTPRTAILTGPTATGKTAVALEFAGRPPGTAVEIINADSMLVYRDLDIGTAKPTPAELAATPHHLIDIREPDAPYTAGDFVRAVREALADIHRRGRRAMIVGGTGFYLKALLHGMWDAGPADPALRHELENRLSTELHAELEKLDPQSAVRIGAGDRYRVIRALEIIRLTGKTPTQLEAEKQADPDPSFELLIIDRATEELEARIRVRTAQMLKAGLIEETRLLREKFPGARALGAVGYRETAAHLEGRTPPGRKLAPGLAGLEAEINLATRQLVKRQRTWFRGQAEGRWFTLDGDRPALDAALAEVYR